MSRRDDVLPKEQRDIELSTKGSSTTPASILHHDRQKHFTHTQVEEYNIFRDSFVRYLGYTNEVGESFRYQFPRFVVPSYMLAFGYCFADSVTSGQKAYQTSNQNKSVALLATADTLLWQALASVMIPGATINAMVKATRYVLRQAPPSVPATVTTWLPTAIGLGSIPLIVHPIDQGVDYFMEHTFRKFMTQHPRTPTHLDTSSTTKSENSNNNAAAASYSVLANALGSASAGICSRCLTHPLDTAKAILQSGNNNNNYRGTVNVLMNTTFSGWYQGFSTVIVGGTPGTIVYLCLYEKFKETGQATFADGKDTSVKNESFLVHFSSGILAEACACVIYVPVDVIKERLQVQQHKTVSFQYKGGWDALTKISKIEGLTALYKGYGATLLSFGSFSGLYWVLYEKFKVWSKDLLEEKGSYNTSALPFPWIVLSSAGAGAMASAITSPLDMAKLRLQVQRGASSSSSNKTSTPVTSYSGMLDALTHAYQMEGMRGLFRGAGARVVHFVPATTITMTLYETCRNFFQKALD